MNRGLVCLALGTNDTPEEVRRAIGSVGGHVDAIVASLDPLGRADELEPVIRECAGVMPVSILRDPRSQGASAVTTNMVLAAVALARDRGCELILTMYGDDEYEIADGVRFDVSMLDGKPCARVRHVDIECDRVRATYDFPRIFAVRDDWEWRGAIHEQPFLSGGVEPERAAAPPGIVYRRAVQRSPEKFANQETILRCHLESHPNDWREAFFLAQAIENLERHDEAAQTYARVAVSLPDSNPYKPEALHRIGNCLHRAGRQGDATLAWAAAFGRFPRAETAFTLAEFYASRAALHSARIWALAACECDPPDNAIVVDESVYRWRAATLYADIMRNYVDRSDGEAKIRGALAAAPNEPAVQLVAAAYGIDGGQHAIKLDPSPSTNTQPGGNSEHT